MKFYIKLIIVFPILLSVIIGQTEKPKYYRSIGFLDHKTGLSLFGYARTLKIHNNNEFFAGIGTLIAANTISLGWKYTFLNEPVKSLIKSITAQIPNPPKVRSCIKPIMVYPR